MSEVSQLTFNGVQVSPGYLTGTIVSNDIVASFRKSWIPFYQRDRINNKSKIDSLISIFKEGRIIDSIKLSVRGQYLTDEKSGLVMVEGEVSIIDGLQRTLALLDSGVDQLCIPVELYMNLTSEEEIKLFHQFNRKATPLKFGDIIKSVEGPYAEEARNIVEDETYPVPVWYHSSWRRLPITSICSLLMCVHRRYVDDVDVANVETGHRLIARLSDSTYQPHVATVSLRLRRILEFMTATLGDYNPRSQLWFKNVLFPMVRLIEVHFMTETHEVDTRGFQKKFEAMPSKLFNSAAFKQTSMGGLVALNPTYRAILDYINFNIHARNALPEPKQYYSTPSVGNKGRAKAE